MTVPVPDDWRQAMRSGSLRCHYCRATATSWDHVVPRYLGGPEHAANLVPACGTCNVAKDWSLPTCPCCRCRTALRWWQANLPDEKREQLKDKLLSVVTLWTSVLAALHESAAL